MAKRKAGRPVKGGQTGRKRAAGRTSMKRVMARARKAPRRKARTRAAARAKTWAKAKKVTIARARAVAPKARIAARTKSLKKAKATSRTGARLPHLDRERRRLTEDTMVPTPPSSLGLDPHGSAARTGREALADSLRKHGTMAPGITAGDVDADFESAYFSGDEAPGGDNPTPDQEVVEDIGTALGVRYADNEELRSTDKVTDRDRHRWELDPASSEDYKDRK